MTTPYGERRWPVGEAAKWDRVLSLIDAGDCWEWTGNIDTHGYGTITFDSQRWYAHRLVYARLVGPIPDGLALDHLCFNKICVNPDHLDPVPNPENVRRALRRRRHCRRGHPLDGLLGSGHRYCLTCNRQRVARYRGER